MGIWLLGLSLAATACGTYLKDQRTISGAVARAQALLDELPTCPAGSDPMAIADLPASEIGDLVSVRGFLSADRAQTCTEMECSARCCNGCGGPLVLKANRNVRAGRQPHVRLQRQWGSMDCTFAAVEQTFGQTPVVVTGRLSEKGAALAGQPPQYYLIDPAQMCRVRG